MPEEVAGRLGRRLSRILVLLPYAIRHPGVSVDELSRKFGVKRRELIEDLQLVFLCGLPGYGPGDLIDVDLQHDRVYVRMADYFSAPLRLTPGEALALYAGGAAIAQLPDLEGADALQRGLAKLGRALGSDPGGTGEIRVRLEEGPEAHLAVLRRALAERRRLSIDYLSTTSGHPTTRTVDPWALIAAVGHWYVVGHDHRSGEERMFRTDRIRRASLLDEPAEVPDDFDPESYRGAFRPRPGQDTATFEISPQAARWFEDYYPVKSASDVSDGWRRIELVISSARWAAILVLRLGSDVRNVRPEAVLEEVRRVARDVAARHAA